MSVLMVTGRPPRMWFTSIIGFGQHHYQHTTRRDGDASSAGFSPRKASTSIYRPDGVGAHLEPLERLEEHATGVGCLYIKDLSRVDLSVLEGIVEESYRTLTSETYAHRAHESFGGPGNGSHRDRDGDGIGSEY